MLFEIYWIPYLYSNYFRLDIWYYLSICLFIWSLCLNVYSVGFQPKRSRQRCRTSKDLTDSKGRDAELKKMSKVNPVIIYDIASLQMLNKQLAENYMWVCYKKFFYLSIIREFNIVCLCTHSHHYYVCTY